MFVFPQEGAFIAMQGSQGSVLIVLVAAESSTCIGSAEQDTRQCCCEGLALRDLLSFCW